jgi:hypothetical protein
MAVFLKLQCPECSHVMKVPQSESWPNFCANCGTFVGVDPNFVPERMNIGTARGKSGDQVFRQMEEASIARAEMVGDPSLKITDMKDNVREGETYVTPVQPSQEYQQQCAALETSAQFMPNVQGLAGMARSGPVQRDGAYALAAIQGGAPGGAPPAPMIPGAGFGGGFAPPG